MSYPYRLTVAVPEAHIANATAMGTCLAAQVQDVWTFSAATWRDGDGNLYAAASGVVGSGVVSTWQEPFVAPSHSPDVDLSAAEAARAIASLVTAPGTVPTASPSIIAAYLAPAGADARAVVAAMGLQDIPVEIP